LITEVFSNLWKFKHFSWSSRTSKLKSEFWIMILGSELKVVIFVIIMSIINYLFPPCKSDPILMISSLYILDSEMIGCIGHHLPSSSLIICGNSTLKHLSLTILHLIRFRGRLLVSLTPLTISSNYKPDRSTSTSLQRWNPFKN